MKLTCTLTGVLVETYDDEAARLLIASGGFVQHEESAEAKPKTPRKTKTTKEQE